jgi:LuxR family transcriptional regulator, quorum-sensing system regulator BjaR1
MSRCDAAFGRAAFEFVDKVERYSTADAVLDAMERMLGRFGFEFFCFNSFPRPGQPFDEVAYAIRVPDAWRELYVKEAFVHDDPSIRQCKRTVHPFEWKEARYDPEREPRAAIVVERAIDFGLSRGFLVPVPGPHGCEGDVWMGGYHLDLTAQNKPGIQLIGLYAFDRIRRLGAKQECRKPDLTAREREVLAWVAHGKSAWEIGVILNIAKRTVEKHIEIAYRKLDAVNRAQAIAIALRERIIDI